MVCVNAQASQAASSGWSKFCAVATSAADSASSSLHSVLSQATATADGSGGSSSGSWTSGGAKKTEHMSDF